MVSKAQKIKIILECLNHSTINYDTEKTQHNFNTIFNNLYDWQRELIAATKTHSECCLIAANRIGKTYIGTFIDAVHLTGLYPDEWDGHKFDHPPLVWCLGYSGEKTRDLLQSQIVGTKRGKTFENGLIPASNIIDSESMAGTSNAVRSVKINYHGFDVTSKLQFWSYSQGQHALMGDSIDWFHIDEEPKDQTIYPQVLTRTATGGNIIDIAKNKSEGGRGILTFTPENGRTETVIKFMDDAGPSQFFMRKGWNDAPHLSEEAKTNLLAAYPAHQKQMRSEGMPMLGHGRIYDLSDDFITCDRFDIQPHWIIIGGMDFGWDHPQAHVQIAINPDTQEIYLTHAWKAEKETANNAWGACQWQKDVPVAWPLDGLMHEKGREDVKQQKDHYAEAGFKLLGAHATFDGKSNSVEQGIYEIRNLMQQGKFKVFRGLNSFIDEFMQYHRDERGNIVKIRDDLLDAVRYAYMMRRFAINKGNVGKEKESVEIPSTLNYL